MQENDELEKYKPCEYCGRPLPKSYADNLCPHCQETQLFRDVKEYIRNNVVNEYEVADHFHIPLRQIKEWIRDGRIEYRVGDVEAAQLSMHCQRCGAPVTFGTLCPKCLKLLNSGSGTAVGSSGIMRMRYLDTPTADSQ